MLTWDYYKKIRNINLKSFIARREIKNYDGLVQILENLGVESPSLLVFQNAYTEQHQVPQAPVAPPVKKEQKVTVVEEKKEVKLVVRAPPTKRKRTTRRKKTSNAK